jgi:hypothetical protein
MRKKAIALLLLAAFTFESIGSAAAGNVQPESSVVIDESGTDTDTQVIGSEKEDAAWIISETDDAAEVSDETVGKTAQLSTGSLSDEAGQIEAGQIEAEAAQSVADEQTEDMDLSSGDMEDSEFQILDMEEVSLDDADLIAETDMLDDQETFEEVTISLDESGTAETATLSLARLRSKARSAVSNEQSFTSYGDQLTGAAAYLYKEMEVEYKKLEETYGAEDA